MAVPQAAGLLRFSSTSGSCLTPKATCDKPRGALRIPLSAGPHGEQDPGAPGPAGRAGARGPALRARRRARPGCCCSARRPVGPTAAPRDARPLSAKLTSREQGLPALGAFPGPRGRGWGGRRVGGPHAEGLCGRAAALSRPRRVRAGARPRGGAVLGVALAGSAERRPAGCRARRLHGSPGRTRGEGASRREATPWARERETEAKLFLRGSSRGGGWTAPGHEWTHLHPLLTLVVAQCPVLGPSATAEHRPPRPPPASPAFALLESRSSHLFCMPSTVGEGGDALHSALGTFQNCASKKKPAL